MHNFEKCKQWNKKFISIFIQWRLHNLYKYKTVPNELFEHIYTYVDVLWNKYRSYEYQCVNESEQLSHHETHSHMQTYTREHSETILTSFKINNNSRTFTIKATPCTFYTAPYSTAQHTNNTLIAQIRPNCSNRKKATSNHAQLFLMICILFYGYRAREFKWSIWFFDCFAWMR